MIRIDEGLINYRGDIVYVRGYVNAYHNVTNEPMIGCHFYHSVDINLSIPVSEIKEIRGEKLTLAEKTNLEYYKQVQDNYYARDEYNYFLEQNCNLDLWDEIYENNRKLKLAIWRETRK